jgi:hypothetical protein
MFFYVLLYMISQNNKKSLLTGKYLLLPRSSTYKALFAFSQLNSLTWAHLTEIALLKTKLGLTYVGYKSCGSRDYLEPLWIAG